MLDRLKAVADTLIALHTNIGYKMIVRYTLLVLFVVAMFNIRSITTGAIEFISDIREEIHAEKMSLQEEYYTDLSPLLAEFRAEIKADRVLYFEYHNSDESLDGMPFKYFNMMKCIPRYGVPEVAGNKYKDISSSMYTELFSEIRDGDIVTCRGSFDTDFRRRYRGVFELLNSNDHAKQMVIFSVPGIRKPIGFIVLEWLEDDVAINVDHEIIHEFLPRINAISAHSRKG